MSQVAFDPKTYAYDPSQRLARPTQQPDRAPSPFESLLDVNTQAAEQPTSPAAENKATDGSQAPPKGTDAKPAAAKDDVPATKPDRVDAAVKPDDGNPSDESKTDVKAKTDAAAGEGIKGVDSTDKPADTTKGDNSTATSANESTQPIIATGTAVLPVVTPLTDQASVPNGADQPAQPQGLPAIVGGSTIKVNALGLSESKVGAVKQVGPEKKAGGDSQVEADPSTNETTDTAPLTAKVSPQPPSDNPQLITGDSDKERVAQARGEVPAKGHQADADGPVTVSAGDANVAASKIVADAAQPAIQTTSQTTPTVILSNAPATQPAPLAVAVPLAGLAVEIAGKALAGKNRFEIRLDPPELGRIEVRLDVDRDGNVTSRLTVDRTDTLDLLRRDASGLERALQDAGLKTADNGLQFSLRDQSLNQQQTNGGSDTAQIVVKDETLPSIDVIPQNYGRLTGQGGGLDIRV